MMDAGQGMAGDVWCLNQIGSMLIHPTSQIVAPDSHILLTPEYPTYLLLPRFHFSLACHSLMLAWARTPLHLELTLVTSRRRPPYYR